MNGTGTFDQDSFERLAGAVTLQGWRDFDVVLAFNRLTIERNCGRAACTVIMEPDKSTFQALFDFTKVFRSVISFTIGESANAVTSVETRRFRGAEEAARWLLEFLETGDPSAAGSGSARGRDRYSQQGA